jgi:hypothetical protein
MTVNNPAVNAALAALAAAETARSEFIASLRAKRFTEWRQAGGCERCAGTGSVLTWSTLDGDGYNEFGQCTGIHAGDEIRSNEYPYAVVGRVEHDIPCTARTLGPIPGTVRSYRGADCNRPYALPIPPLVQSSDEAATIAEHDENVDLAKSLLANVEKRFALVTGCNVEVVKGRKVPIGTKGTVRWVGRDDYSRTGGLRVGIAAEGQEKLIYTSDSNLMVVDGAKDAELPDLYGSGKQVAWARKIRLDAIKGGVDKVTIDNQRDARFWIDNRTRWLRNALAD